MAANTPKSNLGEFYTNIAKTANNGFNSLINSTNTAVNSAVNAIKNTPQTLNSLLPLTNTGKKNNSLFGLLGNNNFKTPTINSPPNTSSNISNSMKNNGSEYLWPVFIFIAISVFTIVIFTRYKEQILAGINNINQKIRDSFNRTSTPLVDASKPPPENVTEPPVAPQNEIMFDADRKKKTSDLLDKLVPVGNPEVFNISKNDYSYYDAEPLCRALGAELATYDQVKEAWSRGADWCNYGWVKGQAAVYPIQEDTYNKVQGGPEEGRNSCGSIGLNGGYFENPELKFGVNCYGVKPPQSDFDVELMMKKGELPKSVPSLKVDQKIQEYRKQLDTLGVLPFNTDKWSTF